jgi:hypothetical protein
MTHISYDKDGNATSFVGIDAVTLFQAAAMRSALGLLKVGIKPNRAYTLTNVLRTAAGITGQSYKGKKDIDRARTDLAAFVENGKRSIPAVQGE